MSRLLILSCSKQKRPGAGLLPAIERYDGPAFRVLRRYLRTEPVDAPLTYVLSARFGLIPVSARIPNYDQLMSPSRAKDLRSKIEPELQAIAAAERRFDAVFIAVGSNYNDAIEGWDSIISSAVAKIAKGSQGGRLARLHDWLWGGSVAPVSSPGSVHPQIDTRFRGQHVCMSPKEALGIARAALLNPTRESSSYQAWFVLVDDQRVAPKWLVAQLTGLAVSAFGTSEAIRLLGQLGFTVHRHT